MALEAAEAMAPPMAESQQPMADGQQHCR